MFNEIKLHFSTLMWKGSIMNEAIVFVFKKKGRGGNDFSGAQTYDHCNR